MIKEKSLSVSDTDFAAIRDTMILLIKQDLDRLLQKIEADLRERFEGGVPLIASCQGEAFITGYRAEFEAGPPAKVESWLRVFHPEEYAKFRKDSLVNCINQRGARGQARAILLLIKSFFSWVTDHGGFGLKAKDSPTAGIKVSALVDATKKIERVLSNAELAAFWHGCDRLGYPTGAYFKMLILTGLRRKEAAQLCWSEVDLDTSRIVIEAERMKARPGKAKPHLVPITDDMRALLESIPRFDGFVFSVSGGRGPITNYGAMKEAIDAEMAKECTFKPWRIHDLRRTCGTRFGALGIPDAIGERVLAHAQPEIKQRYNLHAYESEKREALTKWHEALNVIVSPNVIQLPERRAS